MRALLLFPAVLALAPVAPAEQNAAIKTPWGRVVHPAPNRSLLVVEHWPEDGKLALPVPFPNIVRAWRGGQEKEPLALGFNRDASEITLHLPAKAKGANTIEVLTSEKSARLKDGGLVFSALDSKVHGTKAELESHPGNHRIGFWSDAADRVQWDQPVPAGSYRVELVYSTASPDGTQVKIEIGSQALDLELKSTGTWYRYVVLSAGRVTLKEKAAGVKVGCTRKVGGAVMNLKAVLLHPL